MLGIVLLNEVFFSCSNTDNEELNSYLEDIEVLNTGGEDDYILPPPPPPSQD